MLTSLGTLALALDTDDFVWTPNLGRWSRTCKARELSKTRLRSRLMRRPEARRLRRRVEKCSTKRPCRSGACASCVNAARDRLTKALAPVSERGRSDLWLVWIVDPRDATRPGNLSTLDPNNLRRRLKARLVGLFSQAIFALDFSFNEHAEGRYRSFWAPHFHGLVKFDGTRKQLKAALKKRIPKSDAVPRPVKVEKWDGDISALFYLLKPNFARRIGTDRAERFDRKLGQMRRCRNTRDDRIRAREEHELLFFLDRIGIDGRLAFLNCQLRARQNELVVLPIRPS